MVPYNLTKHSLVDKGAEQREKMLLDSEYMETIVFHL